MDKIKAAGYSKDSETVLTVEEYFDGNDERYPSLCANAGIALSSQDLRAFLMAIAAKECVATVLLRVYEFEDALEYNDAWISSDTVFVVTSASLEEVQAWFASLSPSHVGVETDLRRFNNLPPVPARFRLIGVWWD